MNDRQRNSTRARRICFETHRRIDENGRVYMICSCGCGQHFNPATKRWRADHNVLWTHGGEDTAENLSPILEACDAGKGGKAAKDTTKAAKGERVHDRHFGIKVSSRPMRNQKFRKRMDGSVVER